MPSETRTRRLEERIQQELSDLLTRSVSDPRLEGVTITGVEVDREFARARIYVNALAEEERSEEILQGLASARGFLRSELARRIPIRSMPQLQFRWDETFSRAAGIEALLDQVRKEGEGGASQGGA
jgi:ribosome-binding factor A